MKIGKIQPDALEDKILNKIKYKRQDILLHAGLGEDCAVIDFGEEVAVISSDPITGASTRSGYLAVHVACNDLAATGAHPVALQVVLLLPEEITEGEISSIMEEIHQTAADLKVEISGGHTEVLSSISQPLIVITAVGRARRNNFVPTGNARNGDELIITKGAGLEGTYILAADYEDILLTRGVNRETIVRARGFADELSVLPEGLIAAETGVHAMHDITEGGLYGAAEEIGRASRKGFELNIDNLPVRPETREITRVLNIDPAGLISSGSMLIATANGEILKEKLKAEGIEAGSIGYIRDKGKSIRQKGELQEFKWTGKDELWRLMEEEF